MKQNTASRKIQIGAALVLLIAAAAALALMIAEYRKDSDACRLLYTRSVKKKDIVDAARNALAALSDAEIRVQDYVLTGETVYSEAYTDDVRTWQDESASLALVARKDSATEFAQDLAKAGTRTMDELASVVAVFEKSGREPALDRIRKSTAIAYLDQARNSVTKIEDYDGGRIDQTMPIIITSLKALRRLTEGGAALFLLVVAGAVLLVLELRRGKSAAAGLTAEGSRTAALP